MAAERIPHRSDHKQDERLRRQRFDEPTGVEELLNQFVIPRDNFDLDTIALQGSQHLPHPFLRRIGEGEIAKQGQVLFVRLGIRPPDDTKFVSARMHHRSCSHHAPMDITHGTAREGVRDCGCILP